MSLDSSRAATAGRADQRGAETRLKGAGAGQGSVPEQVSPHHGQRLQLCHLHGRRFGKFS